MEKIDNFSPAEMDIDVDDYRPGDVDRLNLVALDYSITAGSFSR